MPSAPTPPARQTVSQPVSQGTEPPASVVPVRWHWNSALAGALITAILLGGFALWWRRPTPSPVVLHAPPTPIIPTPAATATPAPLTIFVSGAVRKPGVYRLDAGARVVDALSAAGGFAPDANVNVVNQAAPMRDGDQIHVPTMVEEATAPRSGIVSIDPVGTDETSTSSDGGLINVNTATAEELDRLPGIGAKRAADIIANRPYATVDELERVPGIGPATLEELRPYVVVE